MREIQAGIRVLRLRRLWPVALAALLAVTACNSDQTGPSDPGTNPPTVRLQDPVGLGEMVGDATERVLPSLPAGSGRDVLAVSLQQLSTAVQAGDVTPVQSALVRARTSIAQYAAQVSGDDVAAAELDAIRLALDVIEDALTTAIAQ